VQISSRALNVALQQLIMSYATHKKLSAQATNSDQAEDTGLLGEGHTCTTELQRISRELASKSVKLEVLKNRSKELILQKESLMADTVAAQSTIDCLGQQETDFLEKYDVCFTC
jgi:hypothetical protein